MSSRDLAHDVLRATDLLNELFSEYLAPPARMTVTQWAEKNRVLSSKDSSEPGPYRVARTPYALEPQDALSSYSHIEEVVLMWGAQTSKTTVGGNWIGSMIDMNPGPLLIVQPTLDTAKRFSNHRLTPMIKEAAVLQKKVSLNRSRDASNTMLQKDYIGGSLFLTGANSSTALRSMPIRDIFFDEVDAYPMDVNDEGDPIALAEARQSTFARRKRLKTSTPTTKGASRIEDDFLSTDQRYYHIACPHCGELQKLEWGADKDFGLKWQKNDFGVALPETAHYVCRHNGCIIQEYEKSNFLRCVELGGAARWVPSKPDASPRKRGYHLSTLYSPLGFFSWRELVEEWVRALALSKMGDQSKMRAFVNTRLAETWEEFGDRVQHHELARRAESYPLGKCPMGVLMVTAGVDTQPDRLEMRVWGFGRGEESWLVDRHIIYGDPNLEEGMEGSPWTKVTEIRRTTLLHASGAQVLIEAVAIDTGGHNTQAVYHYCRTHSHAHVLAIKGHSLSNKPIIGKPSSVDVNWRGKTMQRSLKLWMVGTDTAKHLIYGRLRMTQMGSGFIHLPDCLRDTDEFEQLTSEKLATRYIKGHQKLEWFKPAGKRNEALDCSIYAYVAACYLGIQTMREPAWLKRENRIAPRDGDLFSSANMSAQPVANTEQEPRSGQIAPTNEQFLQRQPSAAKPSLKRNW